ncbi:DNA-binding response regulator [Frondihabitans sucicola]|uniref:DNA-binding response regulator n=1 Tax=Frondihabitans sucicola TaxID=1268041 RepID=A0ABM8GMF4_9MICO|nr:response regulator transcription factor [Frondihabitans sucicola]BDZ49571.1 DNA-binding response regulator [Frondihabitans sucicola]
MTLSSPTPATASEAVPSRVVLVVEDDPIVAEVVVSYLRRRGHVAELITDGLAAVARVRESRPDLILLDRMLPGIDGLEVCRRIRAEVDVPVIMLTALGQEDDRIDGLEAGADDYLVKPFSPRELMLRVDAVLRRTAVPFEAISVIQRGPFRLDTSRREITLDGRVLPLTVREFDLLEFFVRHADQVFRRDELLKAVWQWELGDLSTVTVHVRRLREKVEPDPSSPVHLLTVWGVGYRFAPTLARPTLARPTAADSGAADEAGSE